MSTGQLRPHVGWSALAGCKQWSPGECLSRMAGNWNTELCTDCVFQPLADRKEVEEI